MGYIQSILISSLLCLLACSRGAVASQSATSSSPPVIGILSQEYSVSSKIRFHFSGHKSYISASYVKAVEASGAMVVPILIGQSEDYYEDIMGRINGLVIPGGAALFNNTDGYKDAGKVLFHIAEKINLKGDHFPILGVCLGFELLLHVANNEQEVRTKCNCFNQGLSLKFMKNGSKTGIFKRFPKKNLKALAKESFTYNYHIWCISKSTMEKTKLVDSWTILSQSQSADKNKFVSVVQSKQFPFVGTQFHPEKHAFEWNTKGHFNHSRIAIETSRLFYDWLVDEAKKNKHCYPSQADLYKDVIYNTAPVMTYPYNDETSFEQLYFFD
uniref:folate gamma-glutamyl hydrolase n=1 Tax=Cacopsylla melanoneura TaxID=428564 RepID=A0A8D8T640_9HEMI